MAEQAFFNRCHFLRLAVKQREVRHGPAHASHSAVEVSLHRGRDRVASATGRAAKTKDARRRAMDGLSSFLAAQPDPCVAVAPLAVVMAPPAVCLFRPPPWEWLAAPQTLGIDWEGEGRPLVQVACARGVAVDASDAPWVQSVLSSTSHVHGIFSRDEEALVARPLQLQPTPRHSLCDAVSRVLVPETRVVKDGTIHARVDWADCARRRCMSDEALRYAVADAWATRALACVAVHHADTYAAAFCDG